MDHKNKILPRWAHLSWYELDFSPPLPGDIPEQRCHLPSATVIWHFQSISAKELAPSPQNLAGKGVPLLCCREKTWGKPKCFLPLSDAVGDSRRRPIPLLFKGAQWKSKRQQHGVSRRDISILSHLKKVITPLIKWLSTVFLRIANVWIRIF